MPDGFVPIFRPSGTGHRAGAVPDPGQNTPSDYVLRADATWSPGPESAAFHQSQLVALTIATGNASATGAAPFSPAFAGVPYVTVSGDDPEAIFSVTGASAGGCIVEMMVAVETIAAESGNATVTAFYG